jgi:deoxyribodipyrimidine photo-lyase
LTTVNGSDGVATDCADERWIGTGPDPDSVPAEATVLLWHREDLRLRDNAALALAAEVGEVHPLFVFDPRFYRSDRVGDGRLSFLHECLAQLDARYRARGSGLALRHGDPREVLRTAMAEVGADLLVYNASVSAGYARERDAAVADWERTHVAADDAIVREGDSRADWQAQAEAYFERAPHAVPDSDAFGAGLDSTASVEGMCERYGVEDVPSRAFRGGCTRARRRLSDFAERLPDYVGGISPPAAAEERTSHLSPYLKFGCLSLRDAYRYVREAGADSRAVDMFTSRLFWNRHFTQKLADDPKATERAVNPVFRGMNRSAHDPESAAAWKRGETGYPLVDASMRALRETGWLNFRMRAMCATFYTYVLRCWWKTGADWYYRHLLDADPGINYEQWQMQSGLVGVHPLRIYNPRKGVRENDPDGEFVRRYVPELADFPTEHLDRPEKAPLSVQEDCGVRIGEDYPRPIVEFEPRREAAREDWAALGDRAREALSDPEVERRASLSRRHDSEGSEMGEGERARGERQSGLDDWAGQ